MIFWKYRDQAGEWRWQLRADNGRIIAESGESYQKEVHCDYGIDIVRRQGPWAQVRTRVEAQATEQA